MLTKPILLTQLTTGPSGSRLLSHVVQSTGGNVPQSREALCQPHSARQTQGVSRPRSDLVKSFSCSVSPKAQLPRLPWGSRRSLFPQVLKQE